MCTYVYLIGWSSYAVVTNTLKFSLSKYIKVYFSPDAGRSGVLFIVVTQWSKLRNFNLCLSICISTTAVAAGREWSEFSDSYYILSLKVMYFTSSHILLDSNRIMPNFKRGRRIEKYGEQD